MILAGEGLGILDLVKDIRKYTAHINRGEATIYVDNKYVLREYNKKSCKESNATKEARAIIKTIKKLM